MSEWLSHYSPKELIGLVATVGGLLFLITMIVATQWASVRRAELHARQAELELTLKQQMLEQGKSADEIAQVLDAGQTKPASRNKHVTGKG